MKNTFYSQGNPYNIVRTTSATYTASVGELIIADETEITLPSGVPAGSVIAVRSSNDTVTTDVVGASGSIDGFSAGATHREAKTGEYVYDGSDWYLRNDVDISNGAIPDSAISQLRFAEGSGDTLSNEFSGQPDATRGGADWVTDSAYEGGYALDFVASNNDYVQYDALHDWIDKDAKATIGVTINLDSVTNDTTIGHLIGQDADGDYVAFGIGVSSNGNLGAQIRYDPSTGIVSDAEGPSASTDRTRLAIAFDAANNVISNIAINGSEVSFNEDSSANRFIVQAESGENVWGGRDGSDADVSFAYIDGVLDNPTKYDGLLSSEEYQQDYEAQPWS